MDKADVPGSVKITFAVAAFTMPELHHVNVVTATRLAIGVQRLVDIPDKMHQEFQRFDTLRSRCLQISQYTFEYGDSIDHAITMIGEGGGNALLRVIAVSGFIERGRTRGYVYKMPSGGLRSTGANLVSPGGD